MLNCLRKRICPDLAQSNDSVHFPDHHFLQHRRLKSPSSQEQQVSLIGPFFPLCCVDLLLGFQLEQNDTAKSVFERNRAGWGGLDTFPAAESQSAQIYRFYLLNLNYFTCDVNITAIYIFDCANTVSYKVSRLWPHHSHLLNCYMVEC